MQKSFLPFPRTPIPSFKKLKYKFMRTAVPRRGALPAGAILSVRKNASRKKVAAGGGIRPGSVFLGQSFLGQ